jgi:hypothetical protein
MMMMSTAYGGRAIIEEWQTAAADSGRTPLPPIAAAAANPRGFEEVRGLCRKAGFCIWPNLNHFTNSSAPTWSHPND